MSTLTTQQKSDIDKLWTEFWTGGITNPLTVIEQISFLMFARLLDVMETTAERRAERTKRGVGNIRVAIESALIPGSKTPKPPASQIHSWPGCHLRTSSSHEMARREMPRPERISAAAGTAAACWECQPV